MGARERFWLRVGSAVSPLCRRLGRRGPQIYGWVHKRWWRAYVKAAGRPIAPLLLALLLSGCAVLP
jgi:hypothetical protein